MLATAVLAESEGVAACWRVLETSVHRRHLSRRALLLERPVPRWIEAHIDTLHTDVGCHWEPLARPPERRPALTAALARLPWSGEWLVHVSTTLPDGATARVEPLAAAWVGHRNAFVEQHRGLVVFIARRRRGRSGPPLENLIQEGVLALCRAVERYDPDRGPRFSSYAVPVIERAIAHARRRMGGGPIGPPRHSTLAVALPPRRRDPRGPGRARPRPPVLVSLDAAVDRLDERGTLGDRLADPDAVAPDTAVIDAIERARLRDAFRALPGEVRDILTRHWGLAGESPWSVQQISRHVGRGAREVQAIIDRARRALQATLNRAHPP